MGGRLFQQFIVDAYAAVEEDRLRWIRNNQATLRAEIYRGLCDALKSGDTVNLLLEEKLYCQLLSQVDHNTCCKIIKTRWQSVHGLVRLTFSSLSHATLIGLR